MFEINAEIIFCTHLHFTHNIHTYSYPKICVSVVDILFFKGIYVGALELLTHVHMHETLTSFVKYIFLDLTFLQN